MKEKLYEGKAKIIYDIGSADTFLLEFKDDATAFNAQKRGTISQKGPRNRDISAALFRYLEGKGVPTQYVESVGEREMVAKRLRMIPVEVVVRNIAAGSLAKRLGLAEGTPLKRTVLEFYYKDDSLGDPMVNEYHIRAMDWATQDEINAMSDMALKVNDCLSEHLKGHGLKLVDFKLEFGVDRDGRVILGDEISPDTCRFWDLKTNEKLDKDRFRQDLGGVEEAYTEVWRRLVTV